MTKYVQLAVVAIVALAMALMIAGGPWGPG
jgi:hypothetical protein